MELAENRFLTNIDTFLIEPGPLAEPLLTSQGQDLSYLIPLQAIASDSEIEESSASLETTFTLNAQAATDTFQVTSLQPTNSGFVIQLNRDLDLGKFNLYDGQDSASDFSDLIVTGAISGEIKGSLVPNATNKTLTFLKTGVTLAPDTYTVKLSSRNDGVVDTNGNLLDGNGDGTQGDDYTNQFTINTTDTRTVSLPDLIRGPAQQAKGGNLETGLPIKIDRAIGLETASFELTYNPNLLLIAKANLAPNLPAGWTIKADLSTPGKAIINLNGPQLTQETGLDLVILSTVVPGNATIGSSQILSLNKLILNGGNLASIADDALHQVGYFGDASGNGKYTGLDASLIARVAINLDTGFDAYPHTDPFIIADLDGNKSLSGTDAAYTSRKAVGLTQNEIPNLPDNLNPAKISELSPSNGTSMVNLTREAIIRFSEPIDPSTINGDSIKVISLGKIVSGRLDVSPTGRFVNFFPDLPWTQSAEIEIKIDGTKILGQDGLPLDADGDGNFGGAIATSFNTLPLTQIQGTNIFGYVYDSYNKNTDGSNRPVVGATIKVDALPNVFAVTDSKGYFQLENLPAPEFAVHIDGATATNAPSGTIYATVGKLFHSVPGQTIQLTMDGQPFDIYLPPMAASDIQTLSSNTNTDVGFGQAGKEQLQKILPNIDPSLWNLVQVTFPAGSARDDLGNAATQATIIPVDPNRLPAPLPPGVAPQLVISIQAGNNGGFSQTAGGATNFNVPAPVQFPNLEGLQPGEKSLIWSFNHDAGMWEVIGTGTVSEDGKVIKSDEGVGIIAPGWHFTNPGSPTDGPKDPPCLTSSEIRETVVDVMTTVGDCLKELAGVHRIINAIFEGAKGIRNLINNAIALRDQIEAAQKQGTTLTVGTVTSSIKLLNDAKLSTVSVIDSLKSQNPVSKALAISKCVESALATFESLCGRLTEDPNSPCSTITVKLVCLGLATARTTLAKVNGLIGKAEEGLKSLGLELACRSIDQLNTIIATAPQNSPSASQSESFSLNTLETALAPEDPLPSEVLNLLKQVISEMGAFDSEFDGVENFGTGLDELQTEVIQTQTNSSLIYTEIGQNPVDAPYLIEYNNFQFRGKTDGNGKIDVVLPADTEYTLSVYDRVNNLVGSVAGKSAPSGSTTEIPIPQYVSTVGLVDTDTEGLVDVLEKIFATDLTKVDTDGDGINDFAEIQQGLDPTGGQAFPTGIIASLPLQGEAVSIVVEGSPTNPNRQTAYLATGDYGLAIVDASQFNNPIILGQLDLPVYASDVDVDPLLQIAAVATGDGGLALVDVSAPMEPVLKKTIDISTDRVAIADGIAYASVGNTLRAIDLLGGEELQTIILPGAGFITDIELEGNYLYTYTNGSDIFSIIDITNEGAAIVRGSLEVNIGSGDVGIAVGNGIAYLAGSGITTIDIADRAHPSLISSADQFFIAREIALNGSGLGLNAAEFQGLGIYDVKDPNITDGILTQIDTPGSSNDVAIASGIAYVADKFPGLQVINYFSFDNKGQAPIVNIGTDIGDRDPNTPGIQVLEGISVPIQVNVIDDVQIRNVELLVDGEVVNNDLSFPFDFFAVTPNITPSQNTVNIQVRATDTGGNTSLSNLLALNLVEDTFAPQIVSTTPNEGGRRRELQSIALRFDEAIDITKLVTTGVTLTNLGADGQLGTPDDLNVSIVGLQTRNYDRTLIILPPQDLVPGQYQLKIAPNIISDRAGNSLANSFSLNFTKRPLTTPLNLGETTVGNLIESGEDEIYTFNGTIGQRFYFDGMKGAYPLGVNIYTPTGERIYSSFFENRFTPVLLETGTYQIVVNGAIGDFSFRLFDLNNIPIIELDKPINGNLPPFQATQLYKLPGTKDELLYFDSLSDPGFTSNWNLYNPNLQNINNNYLGYDFEQILDRHGNYLLEIQGNQENPTNYSFQIITSPTQSAPLTLGEILRDNIGEKGERDIYTFNGNAGQRLYFDGLGDNGNITGRIINSYNQDVISYLDTRYNNNQIFLPINGTYELIIDGYGDTTGNYGFRLADLGVATNLSLDTIFANTLEPGNESDLYQFVGTKGQRLYFDSLADVNNGSWTLYNSNGQYLNSHNLSSDFNFVLAEDGIYNLILEGSSENKINYRFQIINSPTTISSINLGDTIAGNLGKPGEQDIYTFFATKGQRIYFDGLSDNANIYARLYSPNEVQNINYVYTNNNSELITLTETGTYELIVNYDSSNNLGDYKFRILELASQPNLPLNNTVINTINPGKASHIYQFVGNAGQKLFIDDLGSNLSGNWTVYTPGDRYLTSSNIGSDFEVQFPGNGIYTFLLEGNSNNPIAYRFTAQDISDTPVTASGFGQIFNGELALGATTEFTFSGSAGLLINFDSLDRDFDSIYVNIFDPDDNTIWSNNASYDSDVFSLNKSGNYRVQLREIGTNNGDYSFQLLNLAVNSTELILNEWNAGILAANTSQVYRFNGAIAQKLFFDGSENIYTNINAQLITPTGATIYNNNLGYDFGIETLLENGTYYIKLANNNEEERAYNFPIFDLVNVPTLTFDAIVNESINADNNSRIYQFSAGDGDRFYFDSLADVNTGNWYLFGPNDRQLYQTNLIYDFEWDVSQNGVYILYLDTVNSNAIDYSFQAITPTINVSEIAIGNTIASKIEEKGEIDIYTFTVNAGQRLYFDSLQDTLNSSIQLLSPSDRDLFLSLNTLYNREPFTLSETGTYQLIIDPNYDTTGNYSFKLLDLNTAPTITLDGQIDNNLEPGKETDIYQFTATKGQRLYFDSLVNVNNANWNLYGPDNRYITGSNLSNDLQTTINRDGIYHLIIEGYSENIITYSFRTIASQTTTSTLTIGQTIANSLERPGDKDIYTFDGTVGQRLILDALSTNLNYINLQLLTPSGVNLISNYYYYFYDDSQPLTLTETGKYQLIIDDIYTETGNYSFQILDASKQPTLTLNTIVNGIIDPGNSIDIYQFNGKKGQKITYDDRGSNLGASWLIYGPGDRYITSYTIGYDFPEVTVPADGLYALVLQGYSENPINYSFQILGN
jgi:hypothetical protein